jgi:hypothetical protein
MFRLLSGSSSGLYNELRKCCTCLGTLSTTQLSNTQRNGPKLLVFERLKYLFCLYFHALPLYTAWNDVMHLTHFTLLWKRFSMFMSSFWLWKTKFLKPYTHILLVTGLSTDQVYIVFGSQRKTRLRYATQTVLSALCGQAFLRFVGAHVYLVLCL